MEIKNPMEIPELFPVRKSKKQKEAFRASARAYAESLGYSVTEEKGSFGVRNLIIGDPKTAKYLITAHYDTCAWLPMPNLVTPCSFTLYLLYQLLLTAVLLVLPLGISILAGMLTGEFWLGYNLFLILFVIEMVMVMVGPANPSNVNDNTSGVVTVLEIAARLSEAKRRNVCFVLFDLEEAGLIGSSSYRSKHKKETNRQIILNLDCVGEGDEIYFFPTAKLKKDKMKISHLQEIAGTKGEKNITIRTKGTGFYPSDQVQFPYGVGIASLKRGRLGLYVSRIHTPKDTILEKENVNILCDALTTIVCTDAAE